MPAVRLKDISFSYTTSVPLLRHATLHLGPGWTGVVGANGAGKTTLLRLVSGDLEPDAGKIHLDPPHRPFFCRQSVESITDDITAFAGRWDGAAAEIKSRLALEDGALERWSTLSPGERKRWQIGAALVSLPPFLFLDEPTNHLDAEARAALLDALSRFEGVGLIVSHDRSFLNALTYQTLRFEDSTVRLWSGNYDAARSVWEERERDERARHDEAKNERRKLARRLVDERRGAEKKAAARDAAVRAARKDHDATSMGARIRAAAGQARGSRQIGVTRASLERADEVVGSFRFRKDVGRSLFFGYTPAPRPWLIEYETAELRAGEKVLLRDVRLGVRRSDRIQVAGQNGAGKTTLLAALVERASIPPERLLHLPQEISCDEGTALLRSVGDLAEDKRGRVLSFVAALGVDPDLLLGSSAPSPGETRKLKIACGLGLEAWCLVLDEPTNHLDLPAIERLESALSAYPGALVLVTHDSQLAAACTKTVWELRDGAVRCRTTSDDA